ncbi:hypothetical protein MMC29_000570 [Sticta canariensis]|nr:hypothetical protein [Sticta canariensis]
MAVTDAQGAMGSPATHRHASKITRPEKSQYLAWQCVNLHLAPCLILMHDQARTVCRGWPRPSQAVVASKREELADALKAAGIKVDESADSKLYQYYPPFAPTFIRLQDVLLPVEYDGNSGKKDE